MKKQKHNSFTGSNNTMEDDRDYIFSTSGSICTEFEAFRRMQREDEIECPSGADLRERYIEWDEGSDTTFYIPRSKEYRTGY